MDISINELADVIETKFRVSLGNCFKLQKCEIFFPESFKGGFILTYEKDNKQLIVQYLDLQLDILFDNNELFGSIKHPEYSGNMFSRKHLLENIDSISHIIVEGLYL